ncbi:polyketide cyclase/dehydrase/lipid transport protein [Georgenia soli]|uniref:Polyketide cyclase/dehydrase/lipid transport protein n=1 Tax=Georgenia soli TaxID=638953 RepID=A0A2A9EM24_9MICO|nr:polyketide cyclase/dehydrase/lipid transport protein [Georgenia soli]
MTTKVHKTVQVDVPITTVYNQWTQFEDFPHFMGGVEKVTQLTDASLEWVAQIAGVKRTWKARIVEQVPDTRVAWAASEGATNAGTVEFRDLGDGRTEVSLTLEFEPEGVVEKAGDTLGIVERQAESDLKKFKEFIEDEGYATGAWRGTIGAGGSAGTGGTMGAGGSVGTTGVGGTGTTGLGGTTGTTGGI